MTRKMSGRSSLGEVFDPQMQRLQFQSQHTNLKQKLDMDGPVFNTSAEEVEKGKSLGLSFYPIVESISSWSSKGPCWPAFIVPDGALQAIGGELTLIQVTELT